MTNYVSAVRSAVEYGLHDPEDSMAMAMACAAAETAGASARPLSGQWFLYTPQDAAAVASALFVQLRHSADALAELACSAGRITERGGAELPAPAGPGQPANLADALAVLRKASDTVHGLVDRHASTTVRALDSAPGTVVLPGDVHETVVAVAALPAVQHDRAVTLNRRHLDGAYEDTDDGFGCGCDITLTGDGETHNFHRGESEWSLTRESDGQNLPDGTTVFSGWETLSTTLENAHPQQLVNDILHIVINAGQQTK
ncbi:hypothetical protein ABZX40_15035 [Streptomyces sp. NPDC004610]|uniref:hypothetical protein n=1 Tax=unclassified Streptomyces TaxID=2593676 RepID=UPI00339EF1C4